MEIKKFEKQWQNNWGDTLPIAEDLKEQFAPLWLRIHSLPNAKRYPESKEEYEEVIKRYEAVLSDLMMHNVDTFYYVVLTEWNNKDTAPDISPEQFGLKVESYFFWKSIDTDEVETIPQNKMYAHKFVAKVSMGIENIHKLLTLVTEDDVAGIIIAPSNLEWLMHPYDGGADIIVSQTQEKQRLEQNFKNWLS